MPMTKTTTKIRRQPRLEGGRVPAVGCLDPAVEKAIRATQRHCHCSRSWIINEACADAMGVKLTWERRYETPHEIKRRKTA